MTKRDFLHKLLRGLGGAIVEIQENPDRAKYGDIVLRCCLKDISYDVQCEGTKGYYLYRAICALKAKDDFEDTLINSFLKRTDDRLFQQLADILCLYADDGSGKAKNALHEKYRGLVERLSGQKALPYKFCENEQFEYLMICEVDTNKWPAFKMCVADATRVSLARKEGTGDSYDWFFDHCKNKFGKGRIAKYLHRAAEKATVISAFLTEIKEREKTREESSRLRIEPEVTFERYVSRAKEPEKDQYACVRMRMDAMRFSRQATQDELSQLVSIIEGERSDEVRANLLYVFRKINFPADIGLLIEYAEGNCERLQNAAIDALKRFHDRQVRELAVRFVTAGNLDAGLPLLIENWRKQDEILIRERVLLSRKICSKTCWIFI